LIDAVVMAAGEGRRLRPLTERWPKPILPVEGRAVVATIVRDLADAGCRRVTVVTGHLAEQVEELLGDGSGFGIELRYARQPRPDGSADAVSRGLASGAEAPLIVTTADTVFARGDVARFAAVAPPAVAVRREPPRGGSVHVDGGIVRKIAGTEGPLFHASLWSLTPELVPYLDGLGGPPYELAEAVNRAIADGHRVSALEVRRTRDLTDPLDLVQENFSYLRR
jgi:NDP-sugar pyrophosphorylase family protein